MFVDEIPTKVYLLTFSYPSVCDKFGIMFNNFKKILLQIFFFFFWQEDDIPKGYLLFIIRQFVINPVICWLIKKKKKSLG